MGHGGGRDDGARYAGSIARRVPMVAAVTATAGGLILAGELTGDFVAFDADTGTVRYRFNTGGPIGAGIITYEVGGRQYIAVASGRPSRFWVSEHSGRPVGDGVRAREPVRAVTQRVAWICAGQRAAIPNVPNDGVGCVVPMFSGAPRRGR